MMAITTSSSIKVKPRDLERMGNSSKRTGKMSEVEPPAGVWRIPSRQANRRRGVAIHEPLTFNRRVRRRLRRTTNQSLAHRSSRQRLSESDQARRQEPIKPERPKVGPGHLIRSLSNVHSSRGMGPSGTAAKVNPRRPNPLLFGFRLRQRGLRVHVGLALMGIPRSLRGVSRHRSGRDARRIILPASREQDRAANDHERQHHTLKNLHDATP